MEKPYVRVPFGLLKSHAGFISEYKPNLEIFLGSVTLDSASPAELAGSIRVSLPEGVMHTIHGPFMDLCPGAVDSAVRRATRERFIQTIEAAALSGARAIVFHSGYEKWKYDHKIEPWLSSSLGFWPDILHRASESGLRIAIENIFEEDPGSLRLLMDGIDTAVAGICFDAGHFNLFSRMPLEAWTEAIGGNIIEYHLHDNHGDMDAHLPPGDGTFDFRKLFGLMKGREVIHTIEANSPEETLLSVQRITELGAA